MDCRCLSLAVLTLLLAACNDFVPVSSSGFGAYEADVAVLDSGIAVAWYDKRHGNDEIYLRVLDAGLHPLTAELRLTDNVAASYEADVAALGPDLALAWYDKKPSGELVARLGLWTVQGEPRWSKSLTPVGSNGRVPVLESVGERLFMAWVQETPATPAGAGASAIHAAWFDSSGAFLHAPFRMAAASSTTWNLNASALPDGRVALVFDAEFETRSSELYLALVDGRSASVSRLSEDDGHASKYPDLAVNGKHSALSWQDMKTGNDEVFLALFDTDALPAPAGIEAAAARITHTEGESIGAYLAWSGPVLGLAWNDNDSGQHEIWFQSFTAEGAPLQKPQQLTHTPDNSLIPAIAASKEGFVLAWGEVSPGSGGHDDSPDGLRSEIVATLVKPEP